MKRNIILTILSFISLCACAQDIPDTSENTSVKIDEKILIVYFSRAGYNYNGAMPNYVESDLTMIRMSRLLSVQVRRK